MESSLGVLGGTGGFGGTGGGGASTVAGAELLVPEPDALSGLIGSFASVGVGGFS